MDSLAKKISCKKAIIGVIGLGYVGLPRCLQFLKSKFTVYGFDNDKNKLRFLKKNRSYLSSVNSKVLNKLSKNFITTDDFTLINKVDVIIICLPTPIKKNFSPNLTIVRQVFNKIRNHIK